MTNIIREIIEQIDVKATIAQVNYDVLVISHKALEIMSALKSAGEDVWMSSGKSVMINRGFTKKSK